jgi:hypothetical protein
VDAATDDDEDEDDVEEYFSLRLLARCTFPHLNVVMDRMVDRYSSRYGVTQKPVARPPGEHWFEQRQMILGKLKKK